jgi:hypothetical protein
MLQEGCPATFERLEIDRFILRRVLLPTPREAAHPCEGSGAHGRLGCRALLALLLIIALCPAGMPGDAAAHSTNVWRRHFGPGRRPWIQDCLPLRSVTGARPAYF